MEKSMQMRPTIYAVALVMMGCGSREHPAPIAETPAAAPPASIEVASPDIPAEVTRVVLAAVPGMRITGAERKEREGRVYYDVEGERADGSEVELDLLEENGAYKVVEIQRDILWAEVPTNVKAAAAGSPRPFEPARVIESTQTDGSVIYELFAPDAPAKPALEVRVAGGHAEVLEQEWPH
jgi:hypothetical protein